MSLGNVGRLTDVGVEIDKKGFIKSDSIRRADVLIVEERFGARLLCIADQM